MPDMPQQPNHWPNTHTPGSSGTPLDALADLCHVLQVAEANAIYAAQVADLKAKPCKAVLPRLSQEQLVAKLGQLTVADLALMSEQVQVVHPAHFAN